MIRNANPEKANRFCTLTMSKGVRRERAQATERGARMRLGMHPDMLVLYNIYLNYGCDPNIKREQLMGGGLLNRTHMRPILVLMLF